MKVNILCEQLQKKLVFVNRAISTKSQLPVLLNFLLIAKRGKLIIKATDLEIGIETEIPASVEKEGGITVPAKTFFELISSLPAEKIQLQIEGTNLEVKSSKTKSILQTIAKEEFPKLYEDKGKKIAELDDEEIKSNLTPVVFAASTDTMRPAMSGVLIKKDNEGKGLLFVATDGYRLSLKKSGKGDGKRSKEGEIEKPILVPARVLREVIGIKGGEGGEVLIHISKANNQVFFEENGTLVVGRLIEAEFPSFEKIIPTDFDTQVMFDKEEMQNAVRICSIFAKDAASIVRIKIKKDRMQVSARSSSVGENTVEVEARVEGEENEIAFNARYLLELFSNIEGDNLVYEMTGPLNPGVFKIEGDPTFLHLVMPIRIQNEPT